MDNNIINESNLIKTKLDSKEKSIGKLTGTDGLRCGALWSISFEVFCYILMPIFMYGLFKFFGRKRSFLKSFSYWIGVMVLILIMNQFVHILFTQDEVNRGWQYGIIGGAKEWMPNYNPIGFFGHFTFGIMAAGITTVLQFIEKPILDWSHKNY